MLIYFIKNIKQTNTTLFIIKGKIVTPGHTVKILGVVIDAEL